MQSHKNSRTVHELTFDGVVLELHINNGGGAWGAHGLQRRARQVHLIVAVRSYGAAPVRAGAPPTLNRATISAGSVAWRCETCFFV